MTQTPITVDGYAFESAVENAVSDFMNALAPDAPRLNWNFQISAEYIELIALVSAHRHDDPRAVAEWWAALLGLDGDETVSGRRRLTGRLDGMNIDTKVKIWYITDRPEFDAAGARFLQAVGL
ncbi:hypothetical protein ACFXG4_27375 [Nocardia sp. NPDC059246]|uniref:hypothetical protein n=1 Tax=unclassified Nocardia TaxID=2637762 RepID=UPI0036BBE998